MVEARSGARRPRSEEPADDDVPGDDAAPATETLTTLESDTEALAAAEPDTESLATAEPETGDDAEQETDDDAAADPTAPIATATTEATDAPPGPARVALARAGRVPWLTVARVVGLLLGIAAVVTALQLPGAPVVSDSSVVTWPKAGAAPTPTTAFLTPYRPASLRAEVPCAAARAATAATGRRTALATSTSADSSGLIVRSVDGTAEILASGRRIPLTVPSGDCTIRIDADARGITVTPGSGTPTVLAGDPVPEVFAFTTDLTGRDADGLRVEAHTPRWFDSSPTPEKSDLLTLTVQLAAVAVGWLIVLSVLARWRRSQAPTGGAEEPSDVARDLLTRARTAVVRGGRAAGERVLRVARRPGAWCGVAIDAAVVALVAWWSYVGPLTDDDGFAAAIARNALATGHVGNYYRWFNASEAPFTSSQTILGLFMADDVASGATGRVLDLSPLALRLPSVICGMAVWLLLSRAVLPRTVPRSPLLARALAAVGFAAWWLPYDLGARPEPYVALGTVVVLALVLRAVADGTRYRLPLIGAAAAVSALTVTVAPSGTLTAVPVLLCAARLARVLATGSPRPGRRVRPLALAANVALVLGAASVAAAVVFAEQSWHGLLVSTEIHDQIGPSQPWYAEWLRYTYLLGEDSWGSATKRLPVLATVALAIPALVLLARRGKHALGGEAVVALGVGPLGLLVLAVTPSKWSHHFGALAGFGALFLAAVATALLRSALDRTRGDRTLWAGGIAGALAAVAAAAAAFSGPNAWYGYASFGVPSTTEPVTPFDSPLWWLVALAVGLVVVVPVVAVMAARLPSGPPAPTVADDQTPAGETGAFATLDDTGTGHAVGPRAAPPWRDAWVGAAALCAPAVMAGIAATVSVGVLVSSFAGVAEERAGTYSLAGQNLAAPGSPDACGIENDVEVLQDASGGPLAPVSGGGAGTASLRGFVAGGGWSTAPPAPGDSEPGRYAWGSDDGPNSTGEMTSQWFTLPALSEKQELALSVSGHTDEGGSVRIEFGRGDGSSTTSAGERRIVEPEPPQRAYRGYAPDPDRARLQDQARDRSDWRTVTLPRTAIPAGADRVRVRAVDDRGDDGGWVATTGPRIVDVINLRRWLADRKPVLVDWPIAFGLPCRRDHPRVVDGVAQAPGAWLTVPDGPNDPLPNARTLDVTTPDDVVPEQWVGSPSALSSITDTGGVFAGMYETGTVDEYDTRLVGDPGRIWGRLLVPDYGDLKADAYDRRIESRVTPGTAGDPPPVRDPRPRDQE